MASFVFMYRILLSIFCPSSRLPMVKNPILSDRMLFPYLFLFLSLFTFYQPSFLVQSLTRSTLPKFSRILLYYTLTKYNNNICSVISRNLSEHKAIQNKKQRSHNVTHAIPASPRTDVLITSPYSVRRTAAPLLPKPYIIC